MKLSIYGHSGSSNHGNEAIIRGLSRVLNSEEIQLYSFKPEVDRKYELDKLYKIKSFFRMYKRYTISHILLSLYYRITKSQVLVYRYKIKPFLTNVDGVYLLEAGDQYCENLEIKKFYAYINRKITKKGGKTIMLPCTIDSKSLTSKKLVKDLERYSIIFARETLTYNALIEKGLKNAIYMPCPAFVMEPVKCTLPEQFFNSSVVGITVGLLAQGKESFTDIVLNNVNELINYIICNTNYCVALIPHVNVDAKLTDVEPIRKLYDKYKKTQRVIKIDENRADIQKYIISQCRFFITIRTHASIAAYSTGIPTIVIGYSQKSEGIAIDLFGTSEHYVLKVESLSSNFELIKSFQWMKENELSIKKKLSEIIPSYSQKIYTMYDKIKKLRMDD